MIIEGKGIPNAIANKGTYIIKSTLISLGLNCEQGTQRNIFF